MKGEARWGPGLDDHLLQGQNVVTWACALGGKNDFLSFQRL